MNSWKIILATIVIFGAGVITGGMLVSHIDQARMVEAAKSNLSTNSVATNAPTAQPHAGAMVGMEQRRLDFMRKVSLELNLSSEQKSRVDAIVHTQQEEIRKIWDPVWDTIAPRLRGQMTNAHDQIVAELTPEQRLKFEELMKRPPPRKDDSTNHPPKKVTAPADSQSKSNSTTLPNIVAPLGTPASTNL